MHGCGLGGLPSACASPDAASATQDPGQGARPGARGCAPRRTASGPRYPRAAESRGLLPPLLVLAAGPASASARLERWLALTVYSGGSGEGSAWPVGSERLLRPSRLSCTLLCSDSPSSTVSDRRRCSSPRGQAVGRDAHPGRGTGCRCGGTASRDEGEGARAARQRPRPAVGPDASSPAEVTGHQPCDRETIQPRRRPVSDPHPLPASRERPTEGQTATPGSDDCTTYDPSSDLHHPAKHGEEEPPVLTSRPAFASGRP